MKERPPPRKRIIRIVALVYEEVSRDHEFFKELVKDSVERIYGVKVLGVMHRNGEEITEAKADTSTVNDSESKGASKRKPK